MTSLRFQDRADAGRRLAEELTTYADRPDVVVLGLPRGGVPVALEVARSLAAPRRVDDDCLQELRWLYDRRDLIEARRDLAAWLAKWRTGGMACPAFDWLNQF